MKTLKLSKPCCYILIIVKLVGLQSRHEVSPYSSISVFYLPIEVIVVMKFTEENNDVNNEVNIALLDAQYN